MAYELTDFQTQVIDRSNEVPVLVDFWAPWCGPCTMLAPILEKLAGEAEGKWDLVKVNTDEHGDISTKHEIRGIPDVRLFKNGVEVDKFVGQKPAAEILKFLNKHLDSKAVSLADTARQLLADGDTAGAIATLEPMEEKDDEVWIILAAAWLETDPAKVAEAADKIPFGSEFVDRCNALAELAKQVLNASEWPEGDGREALAAVQKRDWDPALDKLIRLIEKDRNAAGGGAVEACKAIFRFLGMRHEIAEKYHRLFSSVLFS